MDVLHAEPLGSATWNAADVALSGIVQAPTRKATQGLRRFLAVFFVIDMLSAPFTFRAKVAKYKSIAADREKLKQTYGLPG